MAVVTPLELAPDTLPRVRGRFLVRKWRGIYVATAWPRKRGAPKDRTTIFLSTQFRNAGKMAANPEPKSYDTAVFLSQGSHWLPRDLLTMAAYGKLYEVILPDGTKCTQSDHGVPPLPDQDIDAMQWFPSNYATFYSAANDTSNRACKGVAFTPRVNMSMTKAAAVIDVTPGVSYNMALATIDGADTIIDIVYGTPITPSTSTLFLRQFALNANLVADTRYALLAYRMSGSPTSSLAIRTPNLPQFMFPNTHLGIATRATINPVLGDVLTVTFSGTASVSMLINNSTMS